MARGENCEIFGTVPRSGFYDRSAIVCQVQMGCAIKTKRAQVTATEFVGT